jgi:hypothetical protein
MVNHWYADQSARFALEKLGTPVISRPPFLAD